MKKKTLVVLFLAMIMMLSLVACGSKETKLKEQCIGKWQIVNGEPFDALSIELYEGGTGTAVKRASYTSDKDTGEIIDEEIYDSPIEWEIEEEVLNITSKSIVGDSIKTGYKVDGNTMTSVDGKLTYSKVEN